MFQAIGEGMALRERFRHTLSIADVLESWRHGSRVRSWLIDPTTGSYRARGTMADILPYVSDTGEVNWVVDDALHMDAPIPVITQALLQLVASHDNQRNGAPAIAMMRHGFGGHPFGADARVARERRTGRVGSFPPETGN